jgi:hypothetical protein
MKDFKFFKGTLNVMDDETRATASFNDDTPEGHMNRRALYHTNRDLYDRLRHPNNEMEQYFVERGFRNNLTEQRDLINTDNQRGFFQPTSTVTVNPTLWTKVKMFGTGAKLVLKSTWVSDPFGVTYVSVLATLVTIIVIAKILSIW